MMPSFLEHARTAFVLALLLAGGPAVAAELQDNEIGVGAAQVQDYLDNAFPSEYQALGGMFTVTVRDPEVGIPATGERLQLSFSASASSSGEAEVPVGRVRMSSGLRYSPPERALYLDQPTLEDLQPASPGQRVDEQTRMLLNLWLADYAGKEPLYRIDPAMLANFGDLQVESARVEDGRIVVRFNQPVRMPDLGDAGD